MKQSIFAFFGWVLFATALIAAHMTWWIVIPCAFVGYVVSEWLIDLYYCLRIAKEFAIHASPA